MSAKTKKRVESIAIRGILILLALVCVFSILWMRLTSVKDTSESTSGRNFLWVNNPTLDNYRRLFSMIPMWKNAFNSVFTTVLGTVTSPFFYSLAGPAFVKYKFPGRNVLFYFVIVTMLVPPEVRAAPLFVIMKKLDLINNLWSLIVSKTATAVGTFYMHQYITDIPDRLTEAAHVGGYGDFEIFTSIVTPVIRPALAFWASVTLTARWNDLFWPPLYLRKQAKYTLTVSISLLPVSEGFSTPWPAILAGTTLIIIPIIVLYLLLQTFQKAGLTAGAVKG